MSENNVEQNGKQAMAEFINGWQSGRLEMKERLLDFISCLTAMEGVELQFVARAGVSYSVRPFRREQKERGRNLFAMIDVIDDDPGQRWLSVCFYEDMISDPEEHGEVIPGGLHGDDGYCFDMFEDDTARADYLKQRLSEAAESAKK